MLSTRQKAWVNERSTSFDVYLWDGKSVYRLIGIRAGAVGANVIGSSESLLECSRRRNGGHKDNVTRLGDFFIFLSKTFYIKVARKFW